MPTSLLSLLSASPLSLFFRLTLMINVMFGALNVLAQTAGAPVGGAAITVRSPFSFDLDNGLFASPEFEFQSKLKGTSSFDLPDQLIQDVVPVQVSGIHASAQYEFYSGSKQVHMGAEHVFASRSLVASFVIDRLLVDTVIEKLVAGVKMQIRVQATCSNVHVRLNPQSTQAMLTVLSDVDGLGLPILRLRYFDFQLGANAWIIDPFTCTGSSGFNTELSKGLQRYLDSADGLKSEVRSQLEKKLAEYESSVRTQFQTPRPLQFGVSGVRASLISQKIVKQTGNRFSIRGVLDLQFQSKKGESRLIELSSPTVWPRLSDSVVRLWLPDEFLPQIQTAAFESGQLEGRFHGTELPPFVTIRKSLINEVVAWPELQLFKKEADFLFDIAMSAPPVMSSITANASGQPQGRLQIANLSAQSWAPEGFGADNTQHFKFTLFQTPFDGDFTLQIQNGVLSMKFSKVKTDLVAKWDSEYLKKARFTQVGTGVMEDSLHSQLTSTGLTYTISVLPLTSAMQLKAMSLKKQDRFYSIDFK